MIIWILRFGLNSLQTCSYLLLSNWRKVKENSSKNIGKVTLDWAQNSGSIYPLISLHNYVAIPNDNKYKLNNNMDNIILYKE